MDQQKTFSREYFLKLLAKIVLLGGFITTGLSSFFYFFRSSQKRPMTVIFDAGDPSDYPLGVTLMADYLTWIIREPEGFYALKAVCTHMKCQPEWNHQKNTFQCPCHNSQFKRNGINISGPAPRPLERLKIYLDNNRLKVDRSKVFRHEKGEWQHPESFLVYRLTS